MKALKTCVRWSVFCNQRAHAEERKTSLHLEGEFVLTEEFNWPLDCSEDLGDDEKWLAEQPSKPPHVVKIKEKHRLRGTTAAHLSSVLRMHDSDDHEFTKNDFQIVGEWPMYVLNLYFTAFPSHESVDQTYSQCISSRCHKMEQSVCQTVGETDKLSQIHFGPSTLFVMLETQPVNAS